MDENAVAEKEKKNKKIALFAMIGVCGLCFIFGVIGGITKFISFVNETGENTEENMKTPEQKEFSDGVFNILNGNNVLGTYKCTHKQCGYVYGYNDDNLYDLKTVDLGEYQIRKIINNRFVLLYDDDEDTGSLHRSGGVKVYDFIQSKVVREFKAIKNYNRNDMLVFIAQDTNDKWGVIKFDKDQVVDMVKPNFDYVGAYVPTGELLNSQLYYAAFNNNDWFIIYINDGSVYSKEFNEPIVAYDGEMLVTKNDNSFNVYDVKGNLLFRDAKDFNFTGSGLLVVNNLSTVTVFDAYAITSLYSHNYVQVGSVTAEESSTGIVIKVNGEEIYNKPDKKKSNRNRNGADYQLIVS